MFGKLLTLLKILDNDENSGSFSEPVDYKGLGLLDYPTIIKKCMDISTVRVVLINIYRKELKQVNIIQ